MLKMMDLQLFADEGFDDIEDTNLDDDDFFMLDDEELDGMYADEDTTPPEDTPEETTEITPDTTPEEIDYSPFLKAISEKAKYDHQPVNVESFDEVVTNFQKGLNYDRQQARLLELQNDPRLTKHGQLQEISQLLGYQSEDQMLDILMQTYYQHTAQSQGLTPQQVEKEYQLKQQEATIQQERMRAEQQRANNAMYEEFLTTYPDAKTTDIKPETWEKVQRGANLTAAYTMQLNQELMDRQRAIEQTQQNKQRAPVKGATTHGGGNPQGKDPFEIGFDSED